MDLARRALEELKESGQLENVLETLRAELAGGERARSGRPAGRHYS